jgi:hypothetical protein
MAYSSYTHMCSSHGQSYTIVYSCNAKREPPPQEHMWFNVRTCTGNLYVHSPMQIAMQATPISSLTESNYMAVHRALIGAEAICHHWCCSKRTLTGAAAGGLVAISLLTYTHGCESNFYWMPCLQNIHSEVQQVPQLDLQHSTVMPGAANQEGQSALSHTCQGYTTLGLSRGMGSHALPH